MKQIHREDTLQNLIDTRDWVKGGRECGNSNFQYIEFGFVQSCRSWSVGVVSYRYSITDGQTQVSSIRPKRIFISDDDE
ncbi:hypothetical protein BOTCAL_0070g00330 [Botryotinia calthae]|uniref:Uncharacterized protein n=1 Tax=Botryotinia calthae TaxID=38488 RepID=A0A4Y8D9J6_9HELO|nr:hypothetical protein BOTCAL_0070g00330 [Botryotinia calthae]